MDANTRKLLEKAIEAAVVIAFIITVYLVLKL